MNSITIGRKHGESDFVVIMGPEVPRSQQLSVFKSACGKRTDDEFEEVRLIDLDQAPTKRITFAPPAKASGVVAASTQTAPPEEPKPAEVPPPQQVPSAPQETDSSPTSPVATGRRRPKP